MVMIARTLGFTGMLFLLLLSGRLGAAEAGVVTVAEGAIRVMRGTMALQLAQGARVQPGDIIETDNRGIGVVEFGDGLILGLGPGTRLFLPETSSRGRGTEPGQPVILLAGWLKAEAGKRAPADGYRILAPALGVAMREARLLARASAQGASLFLESGTGRLLEPDAAGKAARGSELGAGQFAQRAPAQRAAVLDRPTAEFLASMPRSFRDALPARPALLKAEAVAPRVEREVRYDDVRDWLQLPAAWRGELMKRLSVRLRDPDFRAAAIASAPSHPEWHSILFPPRPPEGAPAQQ